MSNPRNQLFEVVLAQIKTDPANLSVYVRSIEPLITNYEQLMTVLRLLNDHSTFPAGYTDEVLSHMQASLPRLLANNEQCESLREFYHDEEHNQLFKFDNYVLRAVQYSHQFEEDFIKFRIIDRLDNLHKGIFARHDGYIRSPYGIESIFKLINICKKLDMTQCEKLIRALDIDFLGLCYFWNHKPDEFKTLFNEPGHDNKAELLGNFYHEMKEKHEWLPWMKSFTVFGRKTSQTQPAVDDGHGLNCKIM